MALNPTAGGDSHNWNYSRPDDPGYSTRLVGTVAAIQEVQAMEFDGNGRPSKPRFWPDSGQPVWNIRMVIVGPKGGFRTWTFQPASKAAKAGEKKSVHIDLFNLAGGVEFKNLIGKTIFIETDAPPAGFGYGKGNPRPWRVGLVNEGPYQLAEPLEPIYQMAQVLANGAVSGGVVQSNPTIPPVDPTTGNLVQQPAAQAPTAAALAAVPVDDDIPF